MTDTKHLRELAMAATKGPWEHGGPDCPDGGKPEFVYCDDVMGTAVAQMPTHAYMTREQKLRNMAYIAAIHPTALLAILDRLEASERDAARYRAIRNAPSVGDWPCVWWTTEDAMLLNDGGSGPLLDGALDTAIDNAIDSEAAK